MTAANARVTANAGARPRGVGAVAATAVAAAVAFAGAIVALGMARREPWATALWPWPDDRLTFWFVAANVAAMSVAVAWIGASGLWRAAAPGALGVAVTAGAMARFLSHGMPLPELNHATLLAALAAGSVAVYLGLRRAPLPPGPPMPMLVRLSLLGFALVLLAAGAALVAGVPGVMPWPLHRGSATLLGWIFIGAACCFAGPVLRRHPPALPAVAPLMGLLTAALVLAPPLVMQLSTVRPEYRLSLLICLVVLACGAALAIWALALHRPTRQAWWPGPLGKAPAGTEA